MLSYVPLPGIDPTQLGLLANQTQGGVLDFFNTFSGGALTRMSVVALGVMPYITASIVVQLATSLSPQLAAIKKEGESGRKKLNQYTRYLTLALALLQSSGIVALADREQLLGQGVPVLAEDRNFFTLILLVVTMTSGAVLV
ncbi:hypothetical protein LTR94_033245, partial [Friedmanniomyces endolithicus]